MSPETHIKLSSRLSNNTTTLTPNRIQQYLDGTTIYAAEQIFELLDPEIIDKFTSKTDTRGTANLNRLHREILKLLNNYVVSDVVKLTPKCINNKGGINHKRFKSVISKINDIKATPEERDRD